ncbi:hypothetical protein [Streptomyces hygroscopicus]|uniref:hypothetical protein n=1 Tax=Streptomyces sp. KHY 26 TaxID=3097359 RepID=UPI0025566381|nr:hypothetical protein [Streptomyces hygroscopicus]
MRLRDPEQRAATEAAARQTGVSLQEYILSAAYARAMVVEHGSWKASGSPRQAVARRSPRTPAAPLPPHGGASPSGRRRTSRDGWGEGHAT